MSEMAVGAATSMFGGAQDIQAGAINKLMQSGTATASAAMGAGSGDGGQVRMQAMQDRGVGQNLDVTA